MQFTLISLPTSIAIYCLASRVFGGKVHSKTLNLISSSDNVNITLNSTMNSTLNDAPNNTPNDAPIIAPTPNTPTPGDSCNKDNIKRESLIISSGN